MCWIRRRLRRKKKRHASKTRATKAVPPTVLLTIVPTLGELFDCSDELSGAIAPERDPASDVGDLIGGDEGVLDETLDVVVVS